MVVFFFKQKTAYEMRISDWSSDVCSSDLGQEPRRCRSEIGYRARRRIDRVAVEPCHRRGQQAAETRDAARRPGNDVIVEPGGGAGSAQIGRASGRERVGPYV